VVRELVWRLLLDQKTAPRAYYELRGTASGYELTSFNLWIILFITTLIFGADDQLRIRVVRLGDTNFVNQGFWNAETTYFAPLETTYPAPSKRHHPTRNAEGWICRGWDIAPPYRILIPCSPCLATRITAQGSGVKETPLRFSVISFIGLPASVSSHPFVSDLR